MKTCWWQNKQSSFYFKTEVSGWWLLYLIPTSLNFSDWVSDQDNQQDKIYFTNIFILLIPRHSQVANWKARPKQIRSSDELVMVFALNTHHPDLTMQSNLSVFLKLTKDR